jgi:hypothetical protein
MKLMQYVVMSFALATGISQAQAQPLPGAPTAPSISEPQTAFGALPGRWIRPDGGFYTATATGDAGTLKLYFELRAGGYNGSTYTLNYDATRDQLKGMYYQAVAKQTFEVVFIRK